MMCATGAAGRNTCPSSAKTRSSTGRPDVTTCCRLATSFAGCHGGTLVSSNPVLANHAGYDTPERTCCVTSIAASGVLPARFRTSPHSSRLCGPSGEACRRSVLASGTFVMTTRRRSGRSALRHQSPLLGRRADGAHRSHHQRCMTRRGRLTLATQAQGLRYRARETRRGGRATPTRLVGPFRDTRSTEHIPPELSCA